MTPADPDRDRALIEYVRLCDGPARPPDVRVFAMAWGSLDSRLIRDLAPIRFRWGWEHGEDEPVEVVLARLPEFAGDEGLLLDLIEVEAEHAPGGPDPAGYVERFPESEAAIVRHFALGRSVGRRWSEAAPPGRGETAPAVSFDAGDGERYAPPNPGGGGSFDDGDEIEFRETVRVGGPLGKGGQKAVRVGFQTRSHRRVAVKAPIRPEARDAMVKEAKVQAQLDHPAIPAVVLIEDGPDRPARFVEKLVEGEEWQDILDRQEREIAAAPEGRPGLVAAALRRNLEILARACDALRYTHARWRIVHLDFKPRNVMVGRFGDIYVIDWGAAIHVADRVDRAVVAVHKSEAWTLVGTPGYMPPEVALREFARIETATDVFLLGATLYQVLTGRAPYAGSDAVDRDRRARLAEVVPPRERAPDRAIPEELAAIAMKAMSREPGDRYPSAAEFASAIDLYLDHDRAEALGATARRTLDEAGRSAEGGPMSREALYASITPLIQAADQFRQAAEGWRPSDPATGPTELESRRRASMLGGEREAWWRLVDLAEKTGDFALAASGLDGLETMPEAYREGVEARRRRVGRLVAKRRRDRVALRVFSAAVPLAAVMLAGAWAYAHYQRLELDATTRDLASQTTIAEANRAKAEAERRRADDQRAIARSEPLIAQARLAEAEAFPQGAARLLASAIAERDTPDLRARRVDLLQKSLVPIASSSRRLQTGALAYSPDGSMMASADAFGDPTIRVWDLSTGREVFDFEGHKGIDQPVGPALVPRVAFRPDRPGEVVSIGQDGTIRRWEIGRPTPVARHPEEGDPPTAPLLALDLDVRDGRALALTGDARGTVAWWDLDGLRAIREVAAHPSRVVAVRFRPGGGGESASVGDDGVVCLWSASGERRAGLTPPAPRPGSIPDARAMTDVAYSPDGSLLAASRKGGEVFVWDARTHALVRALPGHEKGRDGRSWTSRLAFVANDRLLSTGTDGAVREWNPSADAPSIVRGRHEIDLFGNSDVRPIAARPDGLRAASAGSDGTIRVWDLRTGSQVAALQGSQAGTIFALRDSVAVPSKGLLLVAGVGRDAMIRAFDLKTLDEVRRYTEGVAFSGDNNPAPMPVALAVAPDGSRFASATLGGDLIVWETATGKRLRTVPNAHPGPNNPVAEDGSVRAAIAGLAWSRDGKRAATVGADHSVKVWDASTWEVLHQSTDDDPDSAPDGPMARFQSNTLAVAFDLDDDRLILGGRDGVVRVVDVAGKRVVDRLRGHTEPVVAAVLDAPGARLATASEDGRVIVWDRASRRPLRSLEVRPLLDTVRFGDPKGQGDEALLRGRRIDGYKLVTGLAFSPDGRLLAVGQADLGLSLVDVASGRTINRASGHTRERPDMNVLQVHFGPDATIVTAGSDGVAKRWDLNAPDPGPLAVAGGSAKRVAVAPDGGEWAAIDGLGGLVRYRADGLEVPGGRVNLPGDQTTAIAYVPDGRTLLVGSFGGRALAVDRGSGRAVPRLRVPSAYRKGSPVDPRVISRLAASPDGRLAASNRNDNKVDLWTVADGVIRKTFAMPKGRATSLAFAPAGRPRLAAADGDGHVECWDVETFAPLFAREGGPKATDDIGGMAFSPDGSRLVQVGLGGDLIVRSGETGRKSATIATVPSRADTVHDVTRRSLYGVAFAPAGGEAMMATVGGDGVIRLWSPDDRGGYAPAGSRATVRLADFGFLRGAPERATPTSGELRCVAFSADGSVVVAGDYDPPIRRESVASILGDAKSEDAGAVVEATERVTGLRVEGTALRPSPPGRLVPDRRGD